MIFGWEVQSQLKKALSSLCSTIFCHMMQSYEFKVGPHFSLADSPPKFATMEMGNALAHRINAK